jgi:hypothetical protein
MVGRQPKPAAVSPWVMAGAIAALFFGIIGFAKTAGYWKSDVPRSVYQQLVPHANEAQHPMPGALAND